MMLSRRSILQCLTLSATSRFTSQAGAQAGARKPNFIILLADDLGYGDVGCFGSPDVPTPNIDSIAAKGVRFTDGYVTCCVCSPSRAGLMTGRYQQRFGHEFNPDPPIEREVRRHLGLPLTEFTLAQLLKKAGYATGAIGKWHLGISPEFNPLERGFDEYFGFLPAGNTYATEMTEGVEWVHTRKDQPPKAGPRQIPILRGRTPVVEHTYLTDAFGREALSFIDRHHDEPFFLYVPFNAVHEPLQSTNHYLDRFAVIKDERHRMLAAMTSALDDNIGKILARLHERGLENDTMIFFWSDNGCPTFTHAGSNGPLNGSKCTLYEGGIRIPSAMQWTGHVRPGQVYRQPIISTDILPTFLKQAGVGLPKDRKYDGVDLLPYLTGTESGAPHEMLFWRVGRNSAARMGKWKLLQLEHDRNRLYDLESDIGEKKDVAAANPEILKTMRAAIQAWHAQLIEPRWEPQGTANLPINGEDINWDF
jgi:arylsulfatase A-like enzyme